MTGFLSRRKSNMPALSSGPFIRALSLAAILLVALASGCDAVEERISGTTSTPPPPSATTPATPPQSTTPPSPRREATSTSTSGLVLPVSIAGETADLPDYDRGDWRHWTDEDRDCQNARQEVLIAESATAVTFQSDDECRVATGQWTGPYTGQAVADPGSLDVDHMVPLANAHRSGAWAWDRERKREFANYLGYDNHLIATTSSANRAKGAKGPEEWRPPLEDYWCVYAVDWVTIKNEWGLTVTEAEYAALSEMLGTCETTTLLQPRQGTAPVLPTPTTLPSVPTDLRYDPFGPDRDCGDFDSYEEALAFFLAAGGPDSDRHKLDSNGDGQPCETLPGGPSAQSTIGPGDGPSARIVSPTTGFADQNAVDCPGTGPPGHDRGVPGSNAANPDCQQFPAPTSALDVHSFPVPAVTIEPTLIAPTAPATASIPLPSSTAQPTQSPAASESAGEAILDRDCGDFADWEEAQAFFLSEGGPEADPHALDRNKDGVACQSLSGAPDSPPVNPPLPEPIPTPHPTPTAAPTTIAPSFVDLPFDPYGPDRNCEDFPSWWDAQNFYFAAGGPDRDPHNLDGDGDGIACDLAIGVPQTPIDGPVTSPEPVTTSDETDEFIDQNCADFGSWREAQDFFESQGGPDRDPHGLDRNSDGTACESLPGAPTQRSEPQAATPEPQPPVDAFEDRNCSDFNTWQQAQNFYISEGGPEDDPHRLDQDKDGVACESLPGAPKDDG